MTASGARCSPLLRLLSLAATSLIAGCASGPYSSDIPLETLERRSARSPFSYRVPEGWFDASADTTHHLVWLVRADYAATIAVREIRLDPEALQQISDARVLGELTLGLAAGAASTLVLTPLERVSVRAGEGYAFEQVNTDTGDTTRVVVLRTESGAYEVQALLVGGRREALREAVFSAQQRFLEALRP